VFAASNELGGDREKHPEKLDAALGERCGRLVDERGSIGDATPTARDPRRGKAEAHANQKTATQIARHASRTDGPHSRVDPMRWGRVSRERAAPNIRPPSPSRSMLPFADDKVMELYGQFERGVYNEIKT
jgi:hypothetical protein